MYPPRETIPLITRDEPERQQFIIVFIVLFFLDDRLDARLRVRGRQCRVQAANRDQLITGFTGTWQRGGFSGVFA
jgi:hypothetical protein